MAKEYASTVTLSLDDVAKTIRAQKTILRNGIVTFQKNTLLTRLSTVASILSTIFFRSTPLGVASGVLGLVEMISLSEEEIVEQLLKTGNEQLDDLLWYLEDHPEYDLIQIKLPFIEYKVDNKPIRFVTGKGVITRIHVKGKGWENM